MQACSKNLKCHAGLRLVEAQEAAEDETRRGRSRVNKLKLRLSSARLIVSVLSDAEPYF
jgi:hypothetical protein